jgi:Tfp pilus assembly protein PilF
MLAGVSLQTNCRLLRGRLRAAAFPLQGFILVLSLLLAACAQPVERVEPVQFSHLAQMGDSQRRASLRLVVAGLEADAAGQRERALASYERAIRVDGTNPYSYVALARHWIEAGEPARGIVFVDQAEVLLESSGEDTLGARVHLVGLRGRAASMDGRPEEAADFLKRAAEMAPKIWGDGILSADELR